MLLAYFSGRKGGVVGSYDDQGGGLLMEYPRRMFRSTQNRAVLERPWNIVQNVVARIRKLLKILSFRQYVDTRVSVPLYLLVAR